MDLSQLSKNLSEPVDWHPKMNDDGTLLQIKTNKDDLVPIATVKQVNGCEIIIEVGLSISYNTIYFIEHKVQEVMNDDEFLWLHYSNHLEGLHGEKLPDDTIHSGNLEADKYENISDWDISNLKLLHYNVVRAVEGTKQKDVIKPSHYQNGDHDLLYYLGEIIGSEAARGFSIGNIIKYLCQYKQKNGLEDLKKAQEYLSRLIQHEEHKQNG